MRQRYSRELAARYDAFMARLTADPPLNREELLDRAIAAGVNPRKATKLFLKTGQSFGIGAKPLAGRTGQPVDGAVLQAVYGVFETHDRLLRKKARLVFGNNPPIEELRDHLIDAALRAAPQYDPSRGIQFSSWVTRPWPRLILHFRKKYAHQIKFGTDPATRRELLRRQQLAKHEKTPLANLLAAEQREILERAIAQLRPAEQYAIYHAYGLGNPEGLAIRPDERMLNSIKHGAITKLRKLLVTKKPLRGPKQAQKNGRPAPPAPHRPHNAHRRPR